MFTFHRLEPSLETSPQAQLVAGRKSVLGVNLGLFGNILNIRYLRRVLLELDESVSRKDRFCWRSNALVLQAMLVHQL